MGFDSDERREKLNVATEKTRFVLIQNILAHPKEMPSLKELDHANPSRSKSTIRDHLKRLETENIVTTRTLPEDERSRDLPWKFYTLTDAGRSLLDEAGLLAASGTLKELGEMLDRSERVERYANAPRPQDNDE